MQALMSSTSGGRRGDGHGRDDDHTGNDNDPAAAPPVAAPLGDDDEEVFEAVARLSNPGGERREPEARISPAGWQTLADLVGVLASVAARVGVDEELRWRVAALQRAVDSRDPSPFPLALGSTGRNPPPSVVAWSHDRATADELPEVAVWFLAEAACSLAEGAGIDELRAAWAVLEAWSLVVAR
jgi:hypothetical protein